ncbi:MAG: hypothetical protein HGA85_05310 [Nanoarchaeota archaeon]|nr:hypothetical protein [Nanoarchaeota archaeon]
MADVMPCLDKRLLNLDTMYNELPAIAKTHKLTSAIKSIHKIAMEGWDLSVTKRYAIERPEAQELLGNAKPGEFRQDYPLSFTSIRGDWLFFISPASTDLEEIYAPLQSKYDVLTKDCHNLFGTYMLASWTMSFVAATHPMYEGVGRSSRALLPYTLQRKGFLPKFVENKQKNPVHELDTIMTEEIEKVLSAGPFDSYLKKNRARDLINPRISPWARIVSEYVDIDDYYSRLKDALLMRIDRMSMSLMYAENIHYRGAQVLTQANDRFM